MSHFEHGAGDPINSFGLGKTPEQKAAERKAAEREKAISDEFLREQKKKNDAANFAERRARQIRAAQIQKEQCVVLLMEVSPNLDEISAKIIMRISS